jgi:hypothetical protein
MHDHFGSILRSDRIGIQEKGNNSWKAALNSLGSARASRAGDGALAITDFPKIDDQYKTFIG